MRPYKLKPCTQGDIGDVRILQLTGVSEITGMTVIATVWKLDEDSVNLDCDIDDPTNNIVHLNLGEVGGWLPSLPTEGVWKGQLHLTGVNTDLTWPAASPNRPHYFELLVQERNNN